MTWDQLKKWCVLYGPSLANFLIINLKFNEWLSKWSIYRYMRLTCARLCQIRPRVTRPHLPLAGLFGDRCRNLRRLRGEWNPVYEQSLANTDRLPT